MRYRARSLDKCIVVQNIEQRTIPSHQKFPLCPFTVNTSLHPQFLATNDLFYVSVDSPFPECLINGIISYIAFSVSHFCHLAQCTEIHPCYYMYQ